MKILLNKRICDNPEINKDIHVKILYINLS